MQEDRIFGTYSANPGEHSQPRAARGESPAGDSQALPRCSTRISFILAGMQWVGHRDLFALIRRTDRGLVRLNILYLLPLCLLPFGASLLGRYDQEPVALRLYGPILVAIAAMRVGIALYVIGRPHLLWQVIDDRQRRATLALTVFLGLAYLLAMLVAVMAPAVSLVIYGGMPLLYFLSITVLRRGRQRDQEYADFT